MPFRTLTLMDDTLPWARAAPEVHSHEELADGPVDAGVSAAAGYPCIPQDGGW